MKHEAQLSQRGRAMRRIVKTSAKSHMVVQSHWNGTNRKRGYGFLFAFHSNYDRIFGRFDTIHKRDRHPANHTDRHHTTAKAALMHSIARQWRQKLIKVQVRHRTKVAHWTLVRLAVSSSTCTRSRPRSDVKLRRNIGHETKRDFTTWNLLNLFKTRAVMDDGFKF